MYDIKHKYTLSIPLDAYDKLVRNLVDGYDDGILIKSVHMIYEWNHKLYQTLIQTWYWIF